MKSKMFTSFAVGLLLAVFLIGAVSAVDCLLVTEVSIPTSVQEDEGVIDFSFDVTNTGGACVDRTGVLITFTATKTGAFSVIPAFDLAQLATETIDAQFTLDAGQTGDIVITVEQTTDQGDDDPADLSAITITQTEEPEINEDCGLLTIPGTLDINSLDVSVEDGFGDDEDYWYPFDEVRVEFTVENDADWDIEDVEIKICLWDEDAEECVLDEDDMDISDDNFDLNDGDEQDVIVDFKIDPDDLEEGNLDHTLYITATGTIDDNDAGVNDGEETCVMESQDTEIRTNEKFVVINDFEHPDVVAPGETVTISADVWNIGDNDIDEDDIYVKVVSESLKIEEEIEMGDLDKFDNTKIQVTITIPEDAQERYHTFEFQVYDDEDMDDNDLYETEEGDEALFDVNIKVEGEQVPSADELVVSATLQSGGESGEEMVIKTSFVNSGEDVATYFVSVAEHGAWANSVDVSESSITIPSGASKEVTLTFDVKKEASGENTFYVEVLAGSEMVKRQAVSVDITKTGFNLADTFGDNWYIWLIGLLNLILIVIIIVVAIRITRS